MTRVCYAIEDWHRLPAGHDWLTAAERARLEEFRFEKRRRDWLLGRWAAKVALLRAAVEDVARLHHVGVAADPVQGRVDDAAAEQGGDRLVEVRVVVADGDDAV